MLEKIEKRHSDRCDNVTVVALAWDDKSAPGKSMQHEHIRDLTYNDLWLAVSDTEKGIKINTRSSKNQQKKGSKTDLHSGSGAAEDLDSVINEVESFVKKWEEGK